MTEEIEYIHWEDIYRDEFIPAYNNFMQLRSDNSTSLNDLRDSYLTLFNSCYKTMRFYMANKGIFVTPKREVIKTAYKVYLIDDGQNWIDVLTVIENIDKPEYSSILPVYFADKFIKIYTDLNERLTKELENVP